MESLIVQDKKEMQNYNNNDNNNKNMRLGGGRDPLGIMLEIEI